MIKIKLNSLIFPYFYRYITAYNNNSVHTKTLSYDSCVTITIHHYCVDTRGPCNN